MDSLTFTGIVEHIVYHNEDNGYCVFDLLDDELKSEIVCTAFIPKLHEGEYMKVTGKMVKHPSYGEQLKIDEYEKTQPTTTKGIERYLSSGVVKGIGPALAKKIVSKFGDATFLIIEREPERLADIKGISLEKAENIGAVFHEQIELRNAMLTLQEYNITPNMALKIYKKYKSGCVDIILNNPYIMTQDIDGIGFKLADDIALKVGIDLNSEFRIRSGIHHVLTLSTLNGHVYLPKEELIIESIKLLNGDRLVIENQLTELIISRVLTRKIIDNEELLYLNAYFYAENYVAKRLLELNSIDIDSKGDEYNLKLIERAENESNIFLAKNQRDAVKEGLEKGVLVITGGPGTGKTTTINTLIKILEDNGEKILLTAPTGRASKRMTEATNRDAKTIHRLLGVAFGEGDKGTQSFEKNEENPLEADVIIVDESSMIDIMLMYHLSKAIKVGTRLILVGDIDQLPSVGAGNVLKDIIDCGKIKVVELKEIFRQAKESAIIMNAHKINKGEYPDLNDKTKDFFLVPRDLSQKENISKTIVDLVSSRLPKFKNCNPINDIQVLTPMRKSELGVTNLNSLLQAVLNPPHKFKEEKEYRNNIFRVGDKVMHIKNNYNMPWKILDIRGNKIDSGSGIFNGDEGRIKSINKKNELMDVVYDDTKIVTYEFSQLDELELAYAITIHKSQGSEYKTVVMPVFNGPPMLMTRNLLYTGVTRSKELAVLVGDEYSIKRMIDNNTQQLRYTSLNIFINELYEHMKLG